MSRVSFFLSALVLCATRTFGEPTTAKYTYNSSDISYLSNGDSVNEENASKMAWFSGLYDHHKWAGHLKSLNSSKCREDMTVYVHQLQNGTLWATKMYDASGHYSGQFFFGNDYWLGSKSLCDELQNKQTNNEVPPFPVYFYVAKIRININRELTPVTRQLNVGECLPKSCDIRDVHRLLAQEPKEGSNIAIVGIKAVPGDYSLLTDIKVQIIGGFGIITLVIIIIASFVEVFLKHRNTKSKYGDAEAETRNNNNNHEESNKGRKEMVIKQDNEKKSKESVFLRLLLAFSAVNNGKKILTVNVSKESIKCIHGLRFFSIAWIILVHTYLEVFSIAGNKSMRIVVERTFMYQTIANATFSVDTFFFISGLLVTLTFFRTETKKKSLNNEYSCRIFKSDTIKFLLMILYRFFRLTPAYLFVLGINETIFRYLHSNSVFSPAIMDHISCSKFWWRNALYINNLFPQSEICMLWSWYIANDTQFFVVAALLLIIAIRGNKQLKFAAVSIAVLLLASWITSFVIAIKYDYVARVEEPFALFDQLYDKPWLRIGPYLVGMLTGYWLFKVDGSIRFPPFVVLVGWVLSLLCLGSLVYGVGTEGMVAPASAFYAALGHTAWGLSLAWITVACCSKYGGPFNAFFGCRLFLPLSRLTYCAYLIHPVLMCLISFALDGAFLLSTSMVIVIFFGNVVLSFLCAFAISLAFEAPIVNILKILFG